MSATTSGGINGLQAGNSKRAERANERVISTMVTVGGRLSGATLRDDHIVLEVLSVETGTAASSPPVVGSTPQRISTVVVNSPLLTF